MSEPGAVATGSRRNSIELMVATVLNVSLDPVVTAPGSDTAIGTDRKAGLLAKANPFAKVSGEHAVDVTHNVVVG